MDWGYQQDPSQGRRESRNVPCSGYYTKEDTDRGDASKERRDSDRRKVGGGGRRVGYRTESAESGSADPDTYHSQDMEPQGRLRKRETSSRHPQLATAHPQIAELENARAETLEKLQHFDDLNHCYGEQLHAQTALLSGVSQNSSKDMHSANDGGAAEQNKQLMLDRRTQPAKIDHRLGAFPEQRSAFRPLTSSPNSQASVQDSSQWSSPQTDYYDEGQYPRLPAPSENDSGIFGTEVSDANHSTTSQHKGQQHHYGNLSHHSSQQNYQQHQNYLPPHQHSQSSQRRFLPEFPPSLQPKLHTSVSVEDHIGSDDILEQIPFHSRPYAPRRRNLPVHTLSQQDPHEWHQGGGYRMVSPSSLSQVSHIPPWQQYLEPYRKRISSPTSSDSSSCYNPANERLRSAPGSMVSFPGSTLSSSTASSLNSSRSGSKGILPRPSVPGNSSRYHPCIPEFVHKANSETPRNTLQPAQRRYESQSPEDDTNALPNIPSFRKGNPVRPAPPPPSGYKDPSHSSQVGMDSAAGGIYRQKKLHHPDRIPEEKGSRDSLKIKLDMLIHVIKMFSAKTGKDNDGDAANLLLALSRTTETVEVMYQAACLNMLIQIIHNIEHKEDRNHQEVRLRASETLRNIIESNGETRQGKHDLCVLNVLEKIRGHCDMMFEFVASHSESQKVEVATQESLNASCEALLGPLRKLYKYSNDKEKYRQSILTLGGLQATAEVLIVNYRLLAMQKKCTGRSGDKRICHSSKIVTVIISILINLTYGDVDNKSVLCAFELFLKSLMYHISLQNEGIIASGAQVLRNLSWRATSDIKEALLVHDVAITLMSAIDYCNEEGTLQYITSALWNLSAHSLESRTRISSTQCGIAQLVNLLSYNSPSGTTAVVENVGGILKNLSVVIKDDKYRRKFREAGGLAKLAQHLKSKNKTVLANATGVLWNLSAHHFEDQKILWDLGCIPLLDIHRTSEHRNICENARGALRNLLAFGQTNGWCSRSDLVGYSLKTQKGLSKSLSTANSCSFSHLSQPQPQKHSSESLNARPMFVPCRSKSSGGSGYNGSTSSLSHPKPDHRHSRSGGGSYQYPGMDDIDFEVPLRQQKGKNRLKFTRIGSAPQASSMGDDDVDVHECFNYMPCTPTVMVTSSNAAIEGSTRGSKHSASVEPCYPDYHGYPEPHEHHSGHNQPSKSDNNRSDIAPYGYTYSQEMHGLSIPLSNDNNEVATSLSVLESKLDRFDPNQPAPEVSYVDLEPDLEDDDDDIDQPIRREAHPLPSTSARENNSFGLSTKHLGCASVMPGGRDTSGSKSHGGTGKLALDGTGEGSKAKRSEI